MRTHKRLIALVLVVVMALSGSALSAVSAAKLTDADEYGEKGALTGVTLAYAIDILNQLGVVAGVSNVKDDDGKVVEYTFGGDSLVTRQQFALFTARIATARPGFFVVDPNSDAKTNTKFTDLVDNTYTLAIDHCFGEGIIVGTNEEGTLFSPKGNIKFADAVTMLTRALGYTGLVYPTGFMTKAADPEVALIGEYADFPLADVAQNTPITRAQMAMLLWNFLLSQRYELEMVYNGAKNEWDAKRVPRPILESFGIKKTVGYVTAVPGWAADLNVISEGVAGTIKGAGIALANTQFQVYRDICISSPVVNLKRGDYDKDKSEYVYYWDIDSANILTTMDKIGLSEYKDDPLALLGLKVTVYEDKRANPDFNINIPAIVNGSKIELDIDEVDGANNPNDGNVVTSLSVPFPALEDITLDKADFFAARVANLYRFDTDARLKGVKGAEREANTIYLAQKAANKSNYRLELVYNGTLSDGTPEYFYIFRPFEVGVYVKDAEAKTADDKPMVFTTAVTKVATTERKEIKDRIIRHAAKFMDEDIDALVENKAYLYTYYGVNLHIYAELTEEVKAVPTAANFNAKVVTFKLPAGNKNVAFNNNLKALGAWDTPQPYITPNSKGEYTIYYDGDKALLARRTLDGPDEYQRSQYVVILTLSITREVTLRNPETNVRIGQGFRATVLNASTGKVEEMVINLVNGESADDFPIPTGSTLAGTPVRLVNRGFNGDYYDVATRADTNKLFITHVAEKEYAGFNAVPALSNFSANRVTALSLPTLGTGNISAYINANTNIVIYGNIGTVGTPKWGAVRYVGNAAGLKYLTDFIKDNPTAVSELIAVGVGNPATGTASNVFLKTTTVVAGPPASVENFAMVLNVDGNIKLGGYDYGVARLADGKTVNVASTTPGVISRGNLVELTGDKVTAYDVEYTVAKLVNSKVNFGVEPLLTDSAGYKDFMSYLPATPTYLSTTGTAGTLNWRAVELKDVNYYQDYGVDIGSKFLKFDKNAFKVVVAYQYTKEAEVKEDKTKVPPVDFKPAVLDKKLVTEGRPQADPNIKDQFISISQTEFQRILDAGGRIYVVAYTAGSGDDETVVFATMLIDLTRVKTAEASKYLDKPWGWRDP